MDADAWESVRAAVRESNVVAGNSIVRHRGDIGYVAKGLLKEYDARERDRATIINFLGPGDIFINWSFTMHQYVKAAIRTTVYLLPRTAIRPLYDRHPPLAGMFDGLVSAYAEQLAYRTRLLEQRNVADRISLFKARFDTSLPYLRHRDVANYTAISYDYLTRHFSQIP